MSNEQQFRNSRNIKDLSNQEYKISEQKILPLHKTLLNADRMDSTNTHCGSFFICSPTKPVMIKSKPLSHH